MNAMGYREQTVATWINVANRPEDNYWLLKCGGPLSGDVYYSTPTENRMRSE